MQLADKFSKSKLKPIVKPSIKLADIKIVRIGAWRYVITSYLKNFILGRFLLSASYIEQFKGLEAGPLVQFIKYGISGGLATFVHIVLFHLIAWRIFPSLQENDFLLSF